jgi:hypothetical protein
MPRSTTNPKRPNAPVRPQLPPQAKKAASLRSSPQPAGAGARSRPAPQRAQPTMRSGFRG